MAVLLYVRIAIIIAAFYKVIKESIYAHIIINVKKYAVYALIQNVQKKIVIIIVQKKLDIQKSTLVIIFINVMKIVFLWIIQMIVKENVF